MNTAAHTPKGQADYLADIIKCKTSFCYLEELMNDIADAFEKRSQSGEAEPQQSPLYVKAVDAEKRFYDGRHSAERLYLDTEKLNDRDANHVAEMQEGLRNAVEVLAEVAAMQPDTENKLKPYIIHAAQKADTVIKRLQDAIAMPELKDVITAYNRGWEKRKAFLEEGGAYNTYLERQKTNLKGLERAMGCPEMNAYHDERFAAKELMRQTRTREDIEFRRRVAPRPPIQKER